MRGPLDGCLVGSAGARLPTAATAVRGGATELLHGKSRRLLLRRRHGWLAAQSPSPVTSCPKFTAASTTTRIEAYAPKKTLRTSNRTATLSLATPPLRKRDTPPRYYPLAVTAAGDMLAGACLRV